MSKLTIALLTVSMGLTLQAQTQSLGDAARQVRAQKASAPKAKKMFTNENLPKEGTISTPNATPAPAAAPGAAGTAASAAAVVAKDAGKAAKEEEAAYKARYADLKKTQAEEERRLDLLQRELNMAQVQAYSDPNVALKEQFQRTELKKRTGEIDAQKQAVTKAKQAVADLQEELRKKALPAGWAP